MDHHQLQRLLHNIPSRETYGEGGEGPPSWWVTQHDSFLPWHERLLPSSPCLYHRKSLFSQLDESLHHLSIILVLCSVNTGFMLSFTRSPLRPLLQRRRKGFSSSLLHHNIHFTPNVFLFLWTNNVWIGNQFMLPNVLLLSYCLPSVLLINGGNNWDGILDIFWLKKSVWGECSMKEAQVWPKDI